MATCALVVLAAVACGGSDDGALFGPAGASGGASAGRAPTAGSGNDGGTASGGGGAAAQGGELGEAGSGPGVGGSGDGGSGAVTSGGSSAGGRGGSAGASGSANGGTSGGGGSAGSDVAGNSGTAGTNAGTGGGTSCTPRDEVCDGIDNDCDGSLDEGRACGANCTGFALGDRGYMFCSMANTLNAATMACAAEGMRLAWIETQAENAALVVALAPLVNSSGAAGPDPGVRIGATDADDEGEWTWIDGAPFWEGDEDGMAVSDAFANWSEGRPNNGMGSLGGENCAVLIVEDGEDGDAGQWNDVRCTQVQPFVCETP